MIVGMETEATLSGRTLIFQIPVYIIILIFLLGVIDRFGLMISDQAPFGAPYDLDMDGRPSSQQIPEPQPEMVMPLHFAEPLSSTFVDPYAIPDTSQAFAPTLELETSSAEDYDSSDWVFDSPGDDGDGSDHTLTSDCDGLCGVGKGGYCGCH
ncbi:hypothetical protein TSUD_371750 [Trifolium subterraneum]|uniref:Uncharacterized protein n=1 Tax=Trifolium subterraneum TaxID=3900 RepID=A0A2Z6NV92_TRISU|nr:hypothetical protein TSUD_371750 [Trifolium subterraneum]